MNAQISHSAWSAEALLGAWQRLSRNLEPHAFDAPDLARLMANPKAACAKLSEQINAGAYCLQPLRPVQITKNSGGRRMLLIPPLQDRLVQSAMASAVSDIVDHTFCDASYAYRPGRSVLRASRRVRQVISQGNDWMLDADIASCFDNILHAPLIADLKARGLWKNRAAWLFKSFFHAHITAAPDAGFAADACLVRGLPQGSPLSPVLCNITLDALDQAFVVAGVAFVRYADDFVAFGRSEDEVGIAHAIAASVLRSLGLEFNEGKTFVRRVEEGFTYLGVMFDALGEQSIVAEGREEPDEGAPEIVAEGSDAAGVTSLTTVVASAPTDGQVPFWEKPPETVGEREPPASVSEASQTKRETSQIAGERQDAIEVSVTPDPPPPIDEHHEDPLLRTLYLLEPRSTLERDSQTLVVRSAGQVETRIPAARLHQVFAFGEVNLTSGAVALCLEHSIPVMLLSGRGRYFGVIDPIRLDNVEVHRVQFRAADNPVMCLDIARTLIGAKIANSAAMLKRWDRNHPIEDAREIIEQLHTARRNAAEAPNVAILRGIEGSAAAAYFRAIKSILPEHWRFAGRKRQPPPDPVNSLLSYAYTVLYYNVLTLVVGRGLHPHLAFFHIARGGHHALVSDLIEEFRAPIVDALVMDIVLNNKLGPEDFSWPESADEPCLMSGTARRALIHAFERKLNSTIHRPDLGISLDYRRIVDGQILSLVSVLRGHATRYLPYVMRP